MTTVALSSSDGRFDVTVASDDADLIASVLLLLELPRDETAVDRDITDEFGYLEQLARRRERRCRAASPHGTVHSAPAA